MTTLQISSSSHCNLRHVPAFERMVPYLSVVDWFGEIAHSMAVNYSLEVN